MVETRETHDADRICRCSKRHTPRPVHVQRHHVLPLAWGGPDSEDNTVWICPTAHENVHVLLREYKRHEGTPPWEVRRFYGPYIRGLAALGWNAMTSATQSVDLEGPLSRDFPHHHRDVEDPH